MRGTLANRGRLARSGIGMLLLGLGLDVTAHPKAVVERPSVPPSEVRVVGDAIPAPLSAEPGEPNRGRALLAARESANCVLCHAVPDPAIRFSGNVGPSLAGIGARFTAAQLRLRIVDSRRLNAATVMPSYYTVEGLDRVARQYRGQPVLTAQEVEDLVAFLVTLR